MLSITTLLFPACPDLLLEEVTREGQTLFLTVRSSQSRGVCPDCAQESIKVHRRYTRSLADVSLMEYAVVLRVQVRRFFCSNAACARKTFAEPFAGLAVAHARRTNRQASRLRAIAKELGGRPAARESENVLMPVSRHTMLRLLRRFPVPDAPPPLVLGVDDWSIRKGRTYATILVDLQRHRNEIIRGLCASLEAGQPIPSEPDLCQMYSVSRTTVRKALDQLTQEGLLYRIQGKGTFVAPPKLHRRFVNQHVGFHEDMLSHDVEVRTRILEQVIIPASKLVAPQLQIVVGSPVVKLVRVCSIDGDPILISTIYLPYRMLGWQA